MIAVHGSRHFLPPCTECLRNATLIGYFDSFMFEFIVSNFWGAVQIGRPVRRNGGFHGRKAQIRAGEQNQNTPATSASSRNNAILHLF